MTPQWETVADLRSTSSADISIDKTERLQVPGGWLYRTVLTNTVADYADIVAMVFVPEGMHCSNCCPEDEQ